MNISGERADAPAQRVPLGTVAREWTRIGLTGFGGPPAHIALLRTLVVDRKGWMDAREFQDANAACGLLPGPASTQLSIFCAYRVAGPAGAIVGGIGFILPAVIIILLLSVLFLASNPPLWVRGAGAGAGAAVAAVAVQAARGLIGPSYEHVRGNRARTARWIAYLAVGVAAAAVLGAYLVLALLACGLTEVLILQPADRRELVWAAHAGLGLDRRHRRAGVDRVQGRRALVRRRVRDHPPDAGGRRPRLPLDDQRRVPERGRARSGHPRPGRRDGRCRRIRGSRHRAADCSPRSWRSPRRSRSSSSGGGRFEQLRSNQRARAFLDGAGPAAIGAILGAAIVLAGVLQEAWQFAILAGAAVALLILRRGVVETLVAAGALGVLAALAGAPLPH